MSLRSSSSTTGDRSTGSRDAKTILTADGRTGGRRSRPSLRSLRNTDVLRNFTPPTTTGKTAESIPRSLSGGQLNKLSNAKSHLVQRAYSANEHDGRIKERRASIKKSTNHKNSNSLRFHRVDVEWTGQLNDLGAAGVAVGRSQSQEDMTIESLNMEVMDLRPSAHLSLIESSFNSIMDDGARDGFHGALGVQPSHWEVGEYPMHDDGMNVPMKQRSSWNSCQSMSNMASDIDSLSASIISNMSMSQHSNGRSVKSSDKNDLSKSGAEMFRKNVNVKKYVRPIMVIVGLAAITAILIFILGEELFEEGFESFRYESRAAIHNLFGQQQAGEIGVHEGGRKEMELKPVNLPENRIEKASANYFDMKADAELRQNREEKRRMNRAKRNKRARREIEKLHKIRGKNVLIANVGVGNA